MTDGFTPRLDSLPPPQRRLWDELGTLPAEFVLYGGTAIALRLGHRQSEAFDFFGAAEEAKDYLDIDAILHSDQLDLPAEVRTRLVAAVRAVDPGALP